MADLIAQGTDATQRWRRPLPLNETVVLGRSSAWAASWDDRISRAHAELVWDGKDLTIRKLPAARNPVFVAGEEATEFRICSGSHFVIGGTTFTLVAERAFVTVALPQPAEQQAFSAQYLRRMRFRHADQRIEILARLPEVMSAANNDFDQHVRIINLLLAGVPRAEAAALVRVIGDDQPIEVLHWDRRLLTFGDFHPSDGLIREAIRRHESVVHVWNGDDSTSAGFTARQGVDWAYCTPILGDSTAGSAIYIAGRLAAEPTSDTSDPTDFKDDLKFTELVASTFGSLRDRRKLEHERASLSQFFSPIVLEALTAQDPEIALRPREADVSVLFCDLRGFARTSEKLAADLLSLLERVSTALGIATRQICDQGGVLGDFHGDSVMGFWGWPFPQSDAALRAARAALAIRAEFAAAANLPSPLPQAPKGYPGDGGEGSSRATPPHPSPLPRSGGEGEGTRNPLADFRAGIGIATGKAVAGKIGTVDQVKVTAFGPVVNLASRLEDMTKTMQASVLIDEATAAALRKSMPAEIGRLRRAARVRPYGMDQPLEVCELLPPESESTWLTAAHIAEYEQALDDLYAGRWQSAFEHLHRVPAEDRVKDFLTMFIVQHNRTAPDGWNGVIPLTRK